MSIGKNGAQSRRGKWGLLREGCVSQLALFFFLSRGGGREYSSIFIFFPLGCLNDMENDMDEVDKLVRVAILEAGTDPNVLCRRMCGIAKEEGISLLHESFPGLCAVSCEEYARHARNDGGHGEDDAGFRQDVLGRVGVSGLQVAQEALVGLDGA